MKQQRKLEIKVGATVIVGVIILISGFAIFKEWSPLTAQDQIMMRFPTSAGLQSGDQVALNGVNIGKVASVTLDESSVLVNANVAAGTRILEGAVPTIQMLELMGGKKIEITQGTSDKLIPMDHVIVGTVDPDIAGALHLIGDLEGNVRSLGENANELMINANSIIGDKEFIASMKEAAVNLRDLTIEARSILTENRSNINELASNMNQLVKRVDTLLVDIEPRLTSTLDGADNTLASADSLLFSVQQLVQDIRTGNGIISSALYDTSLTAKTERLLAKVDSVLQIIIDDNMKIRIRL
jgi:phospholipid/cholesterol/gamma-HCH transport system substrate-binding protein